MKPSNSLTLEEARTHLQRSQRSRRSQAQGAAWEQEVINTARVRRYLVQHQRPARTAKGWRSAVSGDVGFTDTVFVNLDHADFFVAELKTGESPVTPPQKRWHDRLRAAGVEVHVWYPTDREAMRERLSRFVPPDRRGAMA